MKSNSKNNATNATKTAGKKKPSTKKFIYKGVTYHAVPKAGKVTVRAGGTAKGQQFVVGVFTMATGDWQNDNSDRILPTPIRTKVEQAFAKA